VVIKPSAVYAFIDIAPDRADERRTSAGLREYVVTGDAEVGSRMVGHPDIAKIVFTGSTATGKVSCAGADTLKRLTLELGGNDAGIVLPNTTSPRFWRNCSGAAS